MGHHGHDVRPAGPRASPLPSPRRPTRAAEVPVLHACLTCGRLGPARRCDEHAHLSTGQRGSTRRWRAVRRAVLERDCHRCQRCGIALAGDQDAHVHHIVPKREGGSDHPTNLRALCAYCNLTRGAS